MSKKNRHNSPRQPKKKEEVCFLSGFKKVYTHPVSNDGESGSLPSGNTAFQCLGATKTFLSVYVRTTCSCPFIRSTAIEDQLRIFAKAQELGLEICQAYCPFEMIVLEFLVTVIGTDKHSFAGLNTASDFSGSNPCNFRHEPTSLIKYNAKNNQTALGQSRSYNFF